MQKTQDNASGGDTPDNDPQRITVAEILRTGREKRGQDLRSVANVLRIRYVFLEAIERGDFASLPGDTYAYGFVRTYAGYLNLDKDEIVRQFKEEVESYGARKTLVFPTPVPESKTPGLAILLASVLLLGIAYGGWSAISRFDVELPDWVPFASHGEGAVVASGSESAAATTDQTEPVVTDEAPVASEPELNTGANANIENSTPEVTSPAPAQEENQPEVVVEPENSATAEAPIASPDVTSDTVSNPSPTLSETSTPALSDEQADTTSQAPSAVSDISGQTSPDNNVGEGEPSEELGVGAEANEVGAADEITTETATAVVTPPPPPEPEVFGDGGTASAISIFAEQDSWVHIVDPSGEAIFSRVLRAGSSYNVPNREGLIMTTGNAGGIILKLNGQDLPKIGPMGDVKRNIVLSEDGLLPSIQAE